MKARSATKRRPAPQSTAPTGDYGATVSTVCPATCTGPGLGDGDAGDAGAGFDGTSTGASDDPPMTGTVVFRLAFVVFGRARRVVRVPELLGSGFTEPGTVGAVWGASTAFVAAWFGSSPVPKSSSPRPSEPVPASVASFERSNTTVSSTISLCKRFDAGSSPTVSTRWAKKNPADVWPMTTTRALRRKV